MGDSSAAPDSTPEAYVFACLVHGEWQRALDLIEEFGPLPDYAPHLVEAAVRLLGEEELDAAVRVATRAVELDPAFALGHSALGRALLASSARAARGSDGANDVTAGRAEAALRRAAELDPQEVPARVGLATLYLQQNRLLEARPYVEQALAAAPWDAEAQESFKRLRKAVEAAAKAGVRGEAGTRAVGDGVRSDGSVGEAGAETQQLMAVASELRRLAGQVHQRCAAVRLPTVSLCLITKNEAENLPRVINSVQGLATEVIVVDTGSTDDTVKVARRLGARVDFFEWVDDFAAARNHSLKLATGDWILALDADDEFQRESTVALRQWLGRVPEVNVVGLYRRYPYPGLEKDSVSILPRLWRNGRGLRYEGAIHEKLVTADGQTAQADETLTVTHCHHGIDGMETLAGRHERNLPILLRTLERSPNDPRTLYYIGITHYERAAWNEAVPYLRATVDALGKDIDLVPKAYGCLGFALLKANRPQEAEAALREGLESHPLYPGLWFCMGLVLDNVGRLEEAAEAYEAALRGRFGPSVNWHDWDCREIKPHIALCDIRLSLGDTEAARRHLEAAELFTGPKPQYDQIRRAIEQTRKEQEVRARQRESELARLQAEFSSRDLRAGIRKVECMLDGGETEQAREFVEAWGKARGDGPEALVARGKVLLASGAAEEALSSFRAACESRLDYAEGWRATASALRALGRSDEAEQVLQHTLSLDRDDTETLPLLGELYLAEHRWDEAARCFQRSLEQRDDAWPTWLGLGKSLLRAGNLPTAIHCYQRAATLSGGNALVRMALGEARADLARRSAAVQAQVLAPGGPEPQQYASRVLPVEATREPGRVPPPVRP